MILPWPEISLLFGGIHHDDAIRAGEQILATCSITISIWGVVDPVTPSTRGHGCGDCKKTKLPC